MESQGGARRWGDEIYNHCIEVCARFSHCSATICSHAPLLTLTDTPLFLGSTQEAQASYKCMNDSNYNRDACIKYFKAYKDCKAKQVSNA